MNRYIVVFEINGVRRITDFVRSVDIDHAHGDARRVAKKLLSYNPDNNIEIISIRYHRRAR